MTRKTAILIVILGLVVVTVAGVLLLLLPAVALIIEIQPQMTAGREFMDSLTAEDMPQWIDRAERLLAASPQGADLPAPDDLKALKVLRIHVLPPDTVCFVWVGGFDHTMLVIQRNADGTHTVTAGYSDEESRQLWP